MRVLSVVPVPYVSGLQNMILSYFANLSSAIETHFLLTHWSDGEFARRLDRLNIPYSHSWIGFFSRSIHPKHMYMTLECVSKVPQLYYDFRQTLRMFNPDIIYTANHHELLLLWPMLRLVNLPVLCHMADPAPAHLFYRFCARLYDQVVTRYIAISQSVLERMTMLGIAGSKINLLHPGVDLQRFPVRRPRTAFFADRFGWTEDTVIIGITGQMMAEKGHEDLIEAARMIQAVCPEACFVIGGKTSGHFYTHLQNRIQAYGLIGRVGFTGWLSHSSDFFAGIDIAVVPSRQEEGFGLVAVEAMATGVSVIAAASGGLKDIVDHSENGLLVAKERPDLLSAALQLLIQSPELRRSLGNRGRQKVEQAFALPKQAMKFEYELLSTIRQ